MHLYSIGYATKPFEVFLAQLQHYRIDAVADVRSVPYSKAFDDYHREALQNRLKAHGIRYVYLGDQLGPRSADPSHYDASGQVQFDRLMASALFGEGLERLQTGLQKGFCIALMCAEKDPAICHRSLLIGYALKRQMEVELLHIGFRGELETQTELEHRLMALTDTQPDIFTDQNACLELAYQRALKQHAYRKPGPAG